MSKKFKLISCENIVGIVSADDFRRYQTKHDTTIFCDIELAQYVEYKNKFYRDNWLRPTITDNIQYTTVSIIAIDDSEYDALFEAFQTQEEVAIEADEDATEYPELNETDNDTQVTVEFVREMKIAEMSKACNRAIVNGIDVVLSDGNTHHFSLEVEDQIKIQALALKAQSGEKILFWHEDNKPCKFYNAEDILRIYSGLETTQTKHTTYFNSLKMYILSLNDIDTIKGIYYGIDIPEQYQSEVYKFLINNILRSQNE